MTPRPQGNCSNEQPPLIPDDVVADLPRLQSSYQEMTGSRFNHYFCPFLHIDKPAQLCMGHVIPESYPNSCRKRITQRADIDNFYGAVAEGRFGTLLTLRDSSAFDLVNDKKMLKEMRPRFEVDGEEVEYYPDRGGKDARHTRVTLEREPDGQSVNLVFKKSQDEMLATNDKTWGMFLEGDFRLPAIVTMIKAAYLTLFNMNGYQWALSAGGVNVGYEMLGRFFRENRGKHVSKVREAMKDFFKPYKHMVRPIESVGGDIPLQGTIQDNRVGICELASGQPFGLIVFVRIDSGLHAVLMPAYTNVDAAVAYHKFLNNEREALPFSHGQFDPVSQCWGRHQEAHTATWPKTGDTFDFG